MLQQRLEIISKRFLRKTLPRNDFLQLFSVGFVRNPEAAIRGVFIKKAVLNNFVVFIGKHLCQSLFLIKLRAFRSSGLQLC